jgi:hypothetical protein
VTWRFSRVLFSRRGGVVVVRAQPTGEDGLVMRIFRQLEELLVASPGYLKSAGPIENAFRNCYEAVILWPGQALCSGGVCKGALVDCDDHSICTTDYCQKGVGCQNLDHSTDCMGSNPCKIYFCDSQSGCQSVDATDGQVVFIGSGKLGFPDAALVAFSLGCDLVNVGREALLSIGCIQALKCHTNKCPTGITTQSPWLTHGLEPELKSVRLANYVLSLRKELLSLARACGVAHPALVAADRIEILNDRFGAQTVEQLLGGRGRGAQTF